MRKIKYFVKGFTLIELLIVIALLGALAVGLLAAVDPFEQLKKGKDTSMRNTAAEFFNSQIRYYSAKNQFAWETVSAGGFATGGQMNLGAGLMSQSITETASAGELKAGFYDLGGGSSNLKNIYINYPASDQLIVCFQPQSKSFRIDSNTKYDASGNIVSSCPASATSTSCYICFL